MAWLRLRLMEQHCRRVNSLRFFKLIRERLILAKYKVLQPFRDKETKEKYKKDQVIEMTVKRADEAIKNLKKWDGEFLERIDDKEKSDKGKESKKEGD